MSNLAKDMLLYVAKRVNKPAELLPSIDIAVSSSKFKKYHSATQSDRDSAHNYLRLLDKENKWFSLKFKSRSFEDNDLLERVVITDSNGLLDFLSIPNESIATSMAIEAVLANSLKLPPRFDLLKEQLEESWGKGIHYYGCPYTKYKTLIMGFKAIEWLEMCEDREEAIDYRTLSIKLYGASKELEGIINIVAKLIRSQCPKDIQSEDPKVILAYWGVNRYPPSFRFKGKVNIETPKGLLHLGDAWPFIEIPPDGLLEMNFDVLPSYVLFIENKTTFERYSREIDDAGLIVYTNGFPSRHWQKIITSMSLQLSNTIPFYHWGDIDRGGFEIFKFITNLVNRDVTPYMMNIFTHSVDEQSINVNVLRSVLDGMTGCGAKALESELDMLGSETNYIEWVEQESLPIISPENYSLSN